jgi:hypothetical protein
MQGLKEAGWVEVFRVVALADSAPLDEVADQAMGEGVVERGPQIVERLLGALMARLMGVTEQLRLEARALGNEGAALVEQQAVHQSPTVRGSPLRKLTAKVLRLYVIIVLELGTQGVVVGEERPGQGQDRRYILVALRQCIATVLSFPAWYLTVRSYPNNLVT